MRVGSAAAGPTSGRGGENLDAALILAGGSAKGMADPAPSYMLKNTIHYMQFKYDKLYCKMTPASLESLYFGNKEAVSMIK